MLYIIFCEMIPPIANTNMILLKNFNIGQNCILIINDSIMIKINIFSNQGNKNMII